MTPYEIMKLADLADPDQLWRRNGIEAQGFTPEQRNQMMTGVLLRRHADDVRRIAMLRGRGLSLVITPVGGNGRAVMTIETPAGHKKFGSYPTYAAGGSGGATGGGAPQDDDAKGGNK